MNMIKNQFIYRFKSLRDFLFDIIIYMIVSEFKTEKELLSVYPKKEYFKLQDIFAFYWDKFLFFAKDKNLFIRNVVYRDVGKMINCKTKSMGGFVFKCPKCGNTKYVYHTCKSRFCNSCGIKYAKQRSLNIESKLIGGTHRHLVFTISDILWPFFLEDRSRLNFMFQAVSQTLLSWYSQRYKRLNLKPGFVLTLHTFGRDDKWNVHIHCLLSEFALGSFSEKKIDFIPFDMLRKRFQKILLDLLENHIGKDKFRKTKNLIYSKYDNGFYVRAKKNEFLDSKAAVSYILRYCGRPCFASYRIINIDNDFISFWYQRHEDDLFIVEKIHIFEFIARLIRHIPDEQFKTIRYYGFYASKSHHLYDSCRKLIDKVKLPFYLQLNKWRNLILLSFKKDPLFCSNCNIVMEFDYGFT